MRPSPTALTPRELEAMALRDTGMKVREVAARLGITAKSASTVLATAREKLACA